MLHRIKWDEQTSNTKGDGELGLEGICGRAVGGGDGSSVHSSYSRPATFLIIVELYKVEELY
jgi:hypothetical protein